MSTPTNLYDDPRFFAGYKELRAQPNNCNDLEEKPALFAMLPDMRGRSVLDLGCGFGENCAEFLRRGASRVTGVDISERMLEVAAAEHPGPEFIRGDMSDLSFLEGQYDIILSSLAVHYLEDFGGFVRQVGSKLRPGGYFIFSQEHPLNTSNPRGRFVRDEKGHVTGFTLENYLVGGRRTETWFIDDVIKYHRTF